MCPILQESAVLDHESGILAQTHATAHVSCLGGLLRKTLTLAHCMSTVVGYGHHDVLGITL